MIKLLYIHTFLRSTKWNANLILTCGFPQLVALCTVIHQSIPAVPIPPPPGNRGAFAHVISPGGGASAILSRPPGLGICAPRGDPRAFDTRVFESAMDELRRGVCRTMTCPSGTRETCRCFKGVFSQF